METLEDILNKVDGSIYNPLIDARFGDKWKESIGVERADKEQIVNIAWVQGRRAILLEREIEKLLNKITNK